MDMQCIWSLCARISCRGRPRYRAGSAVGTRARLLSRPPSGLMFTRIKLFVCVGAGLPCGFASVSLLKQPTPGGWGHLRIFSVGAPHIDLAHGAPHRFQCLPAPPDIHSPPIIVSDSKAETDVELQRTRRPRNTHAPRRSIEGAPTAPLQRLWDDEMRGRATHGTALGLAGGGMSCVYTDGALHATSGSVSTRRFSRLIERRRE